MPSGVFNPAILDFAITQRVNPSLRASATRRSIWLTGRISPPNPTSPTAPVIQSTGRSRKLETTASGTYFNPSPGIIDSIEVVAAVEHPTQGGLPKPISLDNSPNPFTTGTNITFNLSSPCSAVFEIHDVTGRLVRVIDGGRLPAGNHSIAWDGNDADGHPAASGIYFVSLKTAHSVLSSKVVRIK